MSYKMMLKMMWLKVRYGMKSYLLFLIGTVAFIAIYILDLLVMDPTDPSQYQSMFMVTFLYVPVLIGQAIQTIEYSPCYYLVPRTSKERKKFIVFQNVVKMILSFLGITILYVLGIAIQPKAIEYLRYWYFLTGISFSVVVGASGYSTYYLQKKKLSYKAYIISYIITVVVMCAIILGGMFFINQNSIRFGMRISIVAIPASLCYNLYYYVRFRKVEAVYENINREEKKFCSRASNCMM